MKIVKTLILLLAASLAGSPASRAQEDIYTKSLLNLLEFTHFSGRDPSLLVKWPGRISLRFSGSISNPRFAQTVTRITDAYADDVIPNTGLQVSVSRDEAGLPTIYHLLLDDPGKQLANINPAIIPGDHEIQKKEFVRGALRLLGRSGGACYFYYAADSTGTLGYALALIDLSASEKEIERCAYPSFMLSSGFRRTSVARISLLSSLTAGGTVRSMTESDKHLLRLIYQSGAFVAGMSKDETLEVARQILLKAK